MDGTTKGNSGRIMARMIALLPEDTKSRLDIIAGLQAFVTQDALDRSRAAQEQALVELQQQAQQQQGLVTSLVEENSRLRAELSKVEAIKASLQSIGLGDTRSNPRSSNGYKVDTVSDDKGTSDASAIEVPLAHANSSLFPRRAADISSASGRINPPSPMHAGMQRFDLSQQQATSQGDAANFTSLAKFSASSPHGSLVAAIDRRIVDGRNTHYLSPSRDPNLAHGIRTGPSRSGISSSPLQVGKVFFAECRRRLDANAYSNFISDIKSLKVNRVTREAVVKNAGALFAPDNLDLVVRLKSLLYSDEENRI